MSRRTSPPRSTPPQPFTFGFIPGLAPHPRWDIARPDHSRAEPPFTRRQRLRCHGRIWYQIRAFLRREELTEIPDAVAADGTPGHPGQAERSRQAGRLAATATRQQADLKDLCDCQEKLVKEVADKLHADLIGGANATRLDRMLRLEHPRLEYDEAIAVLNQRGFAVTNGDSLSRETVTSLTRYAGNLPLHITGFPISTPFLATEPDKGGTARDMGAIYILPYAGTTFRGLVRDERVAFSLDSSRLLRYFLGESGL